jgi:hypothetical protein
LNDTEVVQAAPYLLNAEPLSSRLLAGPIHIIGLVDKKGTRMTNMESMMTIAIVTGFFLCVMSIFERKKWPSDNAETLEAAVRELIGIL